LITDPPIGSAFQRKRSFRHRFWVEILELASMSDIHAGGGLTIAGILVPA
jgi:hypothetical protein